LIPALSSDDHHSPDPFIQEHPEDSDAFCTTLDGKVTDHGGFHGYTCPAFELPKYQFDAPKISQRFHVELWCEKSTIDDILIPLARSYPGFVNVVTGVGHMTLIECEEAVDRIRKLNRPVRMLYLSDFDPSGQKMPPAVARKIEYLIRNEERDIQLEPILLTHEQCIQYRLPRTPLKDGDKQAAGFERRYGEGGTELDALQALHPGEIRRIVVQHINRFYDSDLQSKRYDVADAFEENMKQTQDDIRERFADRITEIDRKREELRAKVQAKLDELAEEIEEEEDELTEEIESLIDDVTEAMREDEPDPDSDDYEWPEPAEGEDWADPLYDSRRSYIEQNDRYARYNGKEIREKKKRGGKRNS
jgi:hypothetical protein